MIHPSLVILTCLCLDFISYFLHSFPFLKVMSVCSCDFFITLCNGDVPAALACSYPSGNYRIMYCLCSIIMFSKCPPPLCLGLLPWIFVLLFTVSLGLDFFCDFVLFCFFFFVQWPKMLPKYPFGNHLLRASHPTFFFIFLLASLDKLICGCMNIGCMLKH